MPRKYRDPRDPELLEAILERIRAMTREEWIRELNWRPEGATETFRTARRTENGDQPMPEPDCEGEPTPR
jgi:hypothetical protein